MFQKHFRQRIHLVSVLNSARKYSNSNLTFIALNLLNLFHKGKLNSGLNSIVDKY